MSDPTHDRQIPIDYEPPTLREVLDRGDDLANHVNTGIFEDRVMDVADGLERAETLRERVIARLMDWTPVAGFEERERETRTEMLWSLELVDHPDLLPRVLAILPEVEVRLRENAYAAKHPYPLAVRIPDDRGDGTFWSCQSCGADFTDNTTEALVVANPFYTGELPHPLHYCWSCLSMALEAFTTSNGGL